MEAQQYSAEEWRFAEVTASEEAMYALWLVERGFTGSRMELARKLGGKSGHGRLVLDELIKYSYLLETSSSLSLGAHGRRALNHVFGDVGLTQDSSARDGRLPVRRGDIVRVRQIKSSIGYQRRQQQTVRGLGLRRLHDEANVKLSPQTIGMINSVSHLVRVMPKKDAEASQAELPLVAAGR